MTLILKVQFIINYINDIENNFFFNYISKVKIFQMKFQFFFLLNKTALIVATEKGNAEIVQLLLSRPELDVNHISVFKKLFFFNRI